MNQIFYCLNSETKFLFANPESWKLQLSPTPSSNPLLANKLNCKLLTIVDRQGQNEKEFFLLVCIPALLRPYTSFQKVTCA